MQPSPNESRNQFPQAPQPSVQDPFSSQQGQAALKAQYLQQAYNAAGSNFYSIAILSLINSVINYFQGSIYFPVGLGITQLIDGFAYALQQEASETGTLFFGIGAVLDIMIFGVVALFGFFIRKQISWLIVLGAVLYLLDGILFLLFQDWIGAGFHAYFLYRIWVSWRPISKLSKTDDTQSAIGTL
ncbi:hypothetical protein ANAEL_03085 [Anaerolineales bacterium]|nr:hypothetical protein ANAEL_03085 [Anaerolineales bacterium]